PPIRSGLTNASCRIYMVANRRVALSLRRHLPRQISENRNHVSKEENNASCALSYGSCHRLPGCPIVSHGAASQYHTLCLRSTQPLARGDRADRRGRSLRL